MLQMYLLCHIMGACKHALLWYVNVCVCVCVGVGTMTRLTQR